MRLWTAQVAAGDPQPLVEHDELRWLDIGAWLSVPWLDADVPIVRALDQQLRDRVVDPRTDARADPRTDARTDAPY